MRRFLCLFAKNKLVFPKEYGWSVKLGPAKDVFLLLENVNLKTLSKFSEFSTPLSNSALENLSILNLENFLPKMILSKTIFPIKSYFLDRFLWNIVQKIVLIKRHPLITPIFPWVILYPKFPRIIIFPDWRVFLDNSLDHSHLIILRFRINFADNIKNICWKLHRNLYAVAKSCKESSCWLWRKSSSVAPQLKPILHASSTIRRQLKLATKMICDTLHVIHSWNNVKNYHSPSLVLSFEQLWFSVIPVQSLWLLGMAPFFI